jgi:hypothetical protein
MDYFEHWFGVAPDGGSGLLELVYVGLGVTVVTALLRRRSIVAFVRKRLSELRFLWR